MAIPAVSGAVTKVELAPAAALFRSLGDPTRLAILRRLAIGEARVGELVEEVGLPQRVRPGRFRAGGPGVGVPAVSARADRPIGQR
jgi:hypothetical protein